MGTKQVPKLALTKTKFCGDGMGCSGPVWPVAEGREGMSWEQGKAVLGAGKG